MLRRPGPGVPHTCPVPASSAACAWRATAYALGRILTRPDLSAEDASAWLEPVAKVLSDGHPGPVQFGRPGV